VNPEPEGEVCQKPHKLLTNGGSGEYAPSLYPLRNSPPLLAKKYTSKVKKGKKLVSVSIPLDGCRLGPCPQFPPDRNFGPTVRAIRRFNQSGAVTNQGFSLADGHNQFLVVTQVAGNATCYADCWRIKKIFVWCISQDNFVSHVTITPVGTDIDSNMYNDKEQIYQCSSRSVSEPGHMCIVTAPDKPLGSWHFSSNVNTAGVLFQMSVGVNAGSSDNRVTMDIEFEYIPNLVGLPLGYGVVTATTTLGALGGRNVLSNMTLVGVNNLG
jgi:hypothetical protein